MRYFLVFGLLASTGCAHHTITYAPVEPDMTIDNAPTPIADEMVSPGYALKFVNQVCGLTAAQLEKAKWDTANQCDLKFTKSFLDRLAYQYPNMDWVKFDAWRKANPLLFQGTTLSDRFKSSEKYAAVTDHDRRQKIDKYNAAKAKLDRLQEEADESAKKASTLSGWANFFGALSNQNQINNLQHQQNQLQWQQQTGGQGIRPY